MSDDKTTNAPAVDAASPKSERNEHATATDAPVVAASEASKEEATAPAAEAKEADSESAPAPDTAPSTAADTTADKKEPETPAEAIAEKTEETVADQPDVEMADDVPAPPAEPEQTDAPAAEAATDAPASTSASNKKRKSIGGSDSKGKKLNKKASKARILHLDAQPGDHYFVKLKGFPQWPVIICDEDMLPNSLLKSRPVTAMREDGTYREDYADGGKRAHDRTFPVMYLSTNEFGWVPNSDLIDLDPETVLDVKMDKMRKDLQAAHQLASESHPLSYYKQVLQEYQDELIAKENAKSAKAAKVATPSKKKPKAASDDDEDVEMADADETETPAAAQKKAKKRKAEENIETPARSDSVKKPKIKLTTNSTPKATNGATTAAPKPAKAATEPKAAKAKSSKKAKDTKDAEEKKPEKEASAPKEPELTAEEKHARKEKEVLYLRHKLQKGLLTRDQEPKEAEMRDMSDYISKLEGFPDLEVAIIRATKINKVLKAILKLDNIPKEAEFNFKSRSQTLLDKWNKLLAVDGGAAAAAAPAEKGGEANGVNGSAKTNGVKKDAVPAATEAGKEKEKEGEKEGEKKEEVKEKETGEKEKEKEKEKESAEEEEEGEKAEEKEKAKTEETKAEAVEATA